MQEYYKFINEPLPYSYKAMEPFIDIQTMYLHHDKHLQTYVDNLNRALWDYPFLQTFTLEQLLCNLESMPMEIRTQIRNNAGGVYNHRFYFNGLSKEHGQRPQGELAEAIDRQYGSYEKFKEEFTGAALSVFACHGVGTVDNRQVDRVVVAEAVLHTKVGDRGGQIGDVRFDSPAVRGASGDGQHFFRSLVRHIGCNRGFRNLRFRTVFGFSISG